MAGSYNHIVDKNGILLNNEDFVCMIENLGDAYECVTEMYDMIAYLSGGKDSLIDEAIKFSQAMNVKSRIYGTLEDE